MKKQYFSLVFIFLSLCISGASYAQLVGGQAFLQGAYVEIGMSSNAAFGTTTSPAGYHPHPSGFGGTNLAEVYDYGHDGWTIGAPPYMGDYTYPGSPFEGWEIQVAGTRSQQYASPAYSFTPYSYSGACTMTATSFTGYSNVGGVISANWAGTFTTGAIVLKLQQQTTVDTFGSAVVVTTKMYNTSASPATGVYYWRSCDPDNDESWPGGAFNTDNVVNAQNDADHRVAVTGTGYSATHPPLTLCTKDCRAVACVYNSWGLTVGQDLAAVWAQTYGPASYAVGVHDPGDIGLGLVFNIGTIAAGDSAVVSYSYVFNGWTGIDSAGSHPEPSVRIAGGPIVGPPLPYPNIVIDTYNACANPGLTLVPVVLPYADDAAWTWSKWTWSPSTGLSATTGTSVLVTTTVLPATITYTVTGTDPATCQTRTMYITFLTCNNVRANSPCYGDTLFLRRVGDSTGCTYLWKGPGGVFTSTQQNPFIYPATYADSGKFYVYRTLLGVTDTDSISVTVHYKPVVTATNNGPLCEGMPDTLLLNTGPGMAGMTYSWSNTSTYTSSLQSPTIPGFVDADTGLYTVVVTSPFGCKDTATTFARMIPQPNPPIITDQNYCQGMLFVPFTVTGLLPGSLLQWYPSGTGGVPTTVAPTVPTSFVGLYHVWATQKVGSCESQRGTDSVRVTTTPPAPAVTGGTQYCQFIGPFIPVTVVPTTPSDSFRWYNFAAGGPWLFPEPVPNIGVVPSGGIYHYWVSLKDSGCEGPRTPVDITIHPKPAKPAITKQWYCQFVIPGALSAGFDGTDPPETFQFYGPGVIPGTPYPPFPNTSTAPDTTNYYVTETTTYGCVSDSALDQVIVRYKPDIPKTKDTRYCQHADNAAPLNLLVDSAYNSDSLEWYQNTLRVPPIPTPNTNTAPGYYSWYVSQWVNGCQSDSGKVTVQIVYKPIFSIWASSPWVCQFDSIQLAVNPLGTSSIYEPFYSWTLPQGAFTVNQTNLGDSMITVKFDSANLNFFVVKLHAVDDSGFCASDSSIQIKVIQQPTMTLYTKPNVCLNDTVQLALTTRSSDANTYSWYIDNSTMTTSNALNIVTSNSNSGGPYLISWTDTGLHVVTVTSRTKEGCLSMPVLDSVAVKPIPDATFGVAQGTGSLCIGDSIYFNANTVNYNYSYEWTPEQYFYNTNKPNIWGRVRDAKDIITLKVTDPYGCYATQSLEIDPGSCCTLLFPNAFTPNAITNHPEDKTFQPIYTGYHQFHLFRIVNRWGQTVFQSANSSDAKWDGTFNGVPQDMGTYYYFVKYDCGGSTFEQKGDVTLVR